MSINSSTVDLSANLNLLNDTPSITLKSGKELIIKDSNNIIGFTNNNIKVYQPLDLTTTNFANAILVYSINSSIYERKYLQKFTKDSANTNNTVVTFSNIVNHTTDMLTFTGKIVVATVNDSEHFTFSGYKNKNNTNFTLNNLTPSSFTYINISMNLSEENLIITISNSYKPDINSYWIISLESINIEVP